MSARMDCSIAFMSARSAITDSFKSSLVEKLSVIVSSTMWVVASASSRVKPAFSKRSVYLRALYMNPPLDG